MKTARKFIAILLLIVVVLLLPVSLLLKNMGNVMFSSEQVEGLVGKHILTHDVMRGVFQPYVTFEADEFEKTSTLQMSEAWDALGDDDWETVIDELALLEGFSAAAGPTVNGVVSWIQGSANDSDTPLDLRLIKNQDVPVESITDVVINGQLACSPEQLEMFYPLEPTATAIVSPADHLSFTRTIYEITISNSNKFTEYVFDEIQVGGLEYAGFRTIYIKPTCPEILGEVIPPSSEIVCNFESETIDQPEVIQDALTISTTRIEPDELVVCAPPADLYDGIADMVIPANTEILPTALDQFPDVVDVSTFIDDGTKQMANQAYQVGSYGWLTVLGILIVAVLVGAGFTKEALKWAGWSLLIAGLFTLAVAVYLNSATDGILDSIISALAQSIPEYLSGAVRALFNDVLAFLSSSTMMQGVVVTVVGLVALIVALVLGKKKSEVTKS